MIVGCYALHLYCDFTDAPHGYEEFPHVYTNELGSVCRARARRAGWLLLPDGRAMCPKCRTVARPVRMGDRWRDVTPSDT